MKILIFNKKTLFIILAIIFIVIVLLSYIAFYNNADETFNMDIHYKGNIDNETVAFACNVDWGNEHILPMLKIFQENDIKITYFVTGIWAEKNPELLKTIYEYGHEVANHGYRHIDYDKLGYEENKEEISKTHNIIKDILGIEATYFGPPSGAYNDNTIKAAKDLEYNVIMWSIDTIDWRDDSNKDIIIDRVVDNIHNSAIILMHPTEETLKALPELIINISEKGYKIGTVNDVVK